MQPTRPLSSNERPIANLQVPRCLSNRALPAILLRSAIVLNDNIAKTMRLTDYPVGATSRSGHGQSKQVRP
jgi:hypothetical protein